MSQHPLNIVILDGYTLNPGDLSWDGFARLGKLIVHDRTAPEEILRRIRGAQIVITNKTPLTAETLSAPEAADVRYIGVLATGYNVVDVKAARQRGIPVTNIPTYSTDSVAQLVFAHLLEICHHVGAHDAAVRKGEWVNSKDFCFWHYPMVELVGKKLGIIGFGSIGSRVAQIGHAFGMEILVLDRKGKGPREGLPYRFVPLEVLFAESDVITLHCPQTPETEGLICAESIAQMKDGVIILNMSRGGLVKEEDLAIGLRARKVAAAGVDVLSTEPPKPDNPLLGAPNLFITPHIAWAPWEARARLMEIAVENLEGFLNGEPVNVV
ncbi:D-2-hydroxyacid dehydrogenase [Acidaminobacter hydrogenoformans]|uniref:Glycerate dehydrogenase n=1 Tax=Acidaminobacter hydrogenoformans DSM 2784 TaxID=1120920 RepID=A0A1G5RTD1_9FIRM|nr:D-2-hydroxyacid dehydrogenase [Acidaminobacter hydrogenoformans]SCZ77344.1 glycerate dehydrogenase [Acidaminobacter hydrogenoformans DSM 2784]